MLVSVCGVEEITIEIWDALLDKAMQTNHPFRLYATECELLRKKRQSTHGSLPQAFIPGVS